jgi:hypothetical protein
MYLSIIHKKSKMAVKIRASVPFPETPGFLAISGPRKPQSNFSFRPGAFRVDFSVILEENFF